MPTALTRACRRVEERSADFSGVTIALGADGLHSDAVVAAFLFAIFVVVVADIIVVVLLFEVTLAVIKFTIFKLSILKFNVGVLFDLSTDIIKSVAVVRACVVFVVFVAAVAILHAIVSTAVAGLVAVGFVIVMLFAI